MTGAFDCEVGGDAEWMGLGRRVGGWVDNFSVEILTFL